MLYLNLLSAKLWKLLAQKEHANNCFALSLMMLMLCGGVCHVFTKKKSLSLSLLMSIYRYKFVMYQIFTSGMPSSYGQLAIVLLLKPCWPSGRMNANPAKERQEKTKQNIMMLIARAPQLLFFFGKLLPTLTSHGGWYEEELLHQTLWQTQLWGNTAELPRSGLLR